MNRKCQANDKGYCKLAIGSKCLYSKKEPYCIITDFTHYLLIKLLLKGKNNG